jgi:excisionase family DNA binding protein
MERLTYTVTEVAQALGISRSKAYTLVAEGAIAVVPLPGRRKLIARATLDRLLGTSEQPDGPTNEPVTATDLEPEPTRSIARSLQARTATQPAHPASDPDASPSPDSYSHSCTRGARK